MANTVARIESRGLCGNPECRGNFTKKRSNQLHCSKKCRNRHSFLRLLAKRRAEGVVPCPHCGKDVWIALTSAAGPGGQPDR